MTSCPAAILNANATITAVCHHCSCSGRAAGRYQDCYFLDTIVITNLDLEKGWDIVKVQDVLFGVDNRCI